MNYHPDTDREIQRLAKAGHTNDDIAEELAIEPAYVDTINPNTTTRQHIIDMWHAGTSKREISAQLLLPLTTIQTVIAAGSPHQTRAPKTPPPPHGTDSIEHLITQAETSNRHHTRQLAARARATIDQITEAVAREVEERALRDRVDRASRELAAARAALRNLNTR